MYSPQNWHDDNIIGIMTNIIDMMTNVFGMMIEVKLPP